MKKDKFPPGWDEERVQKVIDYYIGGIVYFSNEQSTITNEDVLTTRVIEKRVLISLSHHRLITLI